MVLAAQVHLRSLPVLFVPLPRSLLLLCHQSFPQIRTTLLLAPLTCGVALTTSLTSVSLLIGSMQTGNCVILCSISTSALTGTQARTWGYGCSKYFKTMTSVFAMRVPHLICSSFYCFFCFVVCFHSASMFQQSPMTTEPTSQREFV